MTKFKAGDTVVRTADAPKYSWWTPGKAYEVKPGPYCLYVYDDDGDAYDLDEYGDRFEIAPQIPVQSSLQRIHDLRDGHALFLSPEQKDQVSETELTVGEVLVLTKLLGCMALSDFKKFGLTNAEVQTISTLHTDFHFDLTEEFGTQVISAELS